MSPEGLAALMLLAAAALAFALYATRRAARRLSVLDAALARAIAAAAERDARLQALEQAVQTQQLTEQAVATGTALVREVHKGIADIPFNVLEAIPATRTPAKALRGLHDSISNGVYGAIAGLNRAVGRELRKGFEAESFASTARVGLEPRPAFGSSGADIESAPITAKRGRAGASSEAQSLAMDGKPDSAPAGQTETDAAAEPSGESSPPAVPPPKSWG